MKSIVYHSYGGPDVLELVDIPIPEPGESEILVKVQAAAVNPKDCMIRKGKFRRFTGKIFPQQVGYDLAGEVHELGKDAVDFIIGDPVFAMRNGWKGGTYAQYAVVSCKEVAVMPSNISFPQGASVPMAGLTALQALRDEGRLKAGQEVCINGASGGVGSFAVQIAKIMGARVTGVCSQHNIRLVQQLGADATIDYTQRDVLETAQSCDIFFDVFGNKSYSMVKPLLKTRGRYVTTVPGLRNATDAWLRSRLTRKKARLVVVRSLRRDLDQLREWIENRQLKPLVDRVYPLTQAAETHQYVETKRARGKVVLQISH